MICSRAFGRVKGSGSGQTQAGLQLKSSKAPPQPTRPLDLGGRM